MNTSTDSALLRAATTHRASWRRERGTRGMEAGLPQPEPRSPPGRAVRLRRNPSVSTRACTRLSSSCTAAPHPARTRRAEPRAAAKCAAAQPMRASSLFPRKQMREPCCLACRPGAVRLVAVGVGAAQHQHVSQLRPAAAARRRWLSAQRLRPPSLGRHSRGAGRCFYATQGPSSSFRIGGGQRLKFCCKAAALRSGGPSVRASPRKRAHAPPQSAPTTARVGSPCAR